MTNGPISLSKYRKVPGPAEARAQADANSVKFGRPKSERRAQDQAAEAAKRRIDGSKREKPDPV